MFENIYARCLPNHRNVKEMICALKILGKNHGIRLMLKTIREMFVFACSISRFHKMVTNYAHNEFVGFHFP